MTARPSFMIARQSTQGKCVKCRARYVWHGKPLLRAALCPVHKTPLERTTSTLRRYQTRHVTPLWAKETK